MLRKQLTQLSINEARTLESKSGIINADIDSQLATLQQPLVAKLGEALPLCANCGYERQPLSIAAPTTS